MSTPKVSNKNLNIFYQKEDIIKEKKVNLLNEIDLLKDKRENNDNKVIQYLVDSQIEALNKIKKLSIENSDLFA